MLYELEDGIIVNFSGCHSVSYELEGEKLINFLCYSALHSFMSRLVPVALTLKTHLSSESNPVCAQ